MTPDTTGDSNIARCLSVPEKLQPAVNWALEQLTFADNWEEVGDLTPAECAAAMVDVLSAYYESEDCTLPNTPQNDFLLWKEANVTAGSAMVSGILASQELNTVWFQTGVALNDEVEFKVMLEQGTYDLTIHGRKFSGSGIQHWIIDGAEDAQTIDMYNATSSLNFEATISIVVTFSGEHSLKCKISSKNGASSGYANHMGYIKLTRTGD